MKKSMLFIAIFALLAIVNAQNDSTNRQILEINGYFSTDERFLYKNSNPWIWNENRLNLQFSKESDNYQFGSKVWVRNFGVPNYNNISNLFDKNTMQPLNIELREIYLKTNNFIINNLDLTVGKQFFNWGTADKINPTNNINPYDFEDILDFGRKRGVWGLNLEYYFAQRYKLQTILTPLFEPSNLPVGEFSNLFVPEISLPNPQLHLNQLFLDTLSIPTNKFESRFSAAFKFKATFSYIDFSVSYAYTYDHLPFAHYCKIVPVDMLGNVDLMVKTKYFRQHIIGLDAVSNIFGANIWAEVAAFLPTNDVVLTTDLTALYPLFSPVKTIDSVVIESKKPYWKYIVGFDYFFPYDFYINVQYNHGFVHERGEKELNDYLFLRLEKNLFYNKLKIIPLQGAFIISDWDKLKDNYTLVYMPEIVYKPFENAEFSLQTSIIDGKGSNIFNKIKDFDAFMLKLKFYF